MRMLTLTKSIKKIMGVAAFIGAVAIAPVNASMYGMSGMQGMNGMGGMSGMQGMGGMSGMQGMGGMSGMQGMGGMSGMSGMAGMNGYFKITPQGQIFFYPPGQS